MKDVLRLALPLTVWLVGFSAIYALQGLACSRHWPADLDARAVLIVAGAVAVALQAVILIITLSYPSASRSLQNATAALAAAGIVAALWTIMPVAAVTVCR